MFAKQVSVFIENRQGRLGEVLKVLKDNGVNILSMSLADTSEYGLLRLIVNNPEKGKAELSASGFSTILSDVLIVKITHRVGSLQSVLESLAKQQINVEYMYGLSTEGDEATVVMKFNNQPLAESLLTEAGLATLSIEELL